MLPLQDEASLTIAVVGSACDAENDISALTSRWDLGNQYVVGGSGRVIPPTVVTILNGITKRVQHATIITSITDNVNDAIAVSNNADVVLTCGSATTSEDRDRDSLKLQEEDFLVQLSSGVNSKPIVVILMVRGDRAWCLSAKRENIYLQISLYHSLVSLRIQELRISFVLLTIIIECYEILNSLFAL